MSSEEDGRAPDGKRGKLKTLAYIATPAYEIRRAYESVTSLGANLRNLTTAVLRHRDHGPLEEGDLRLIEDPKERFEAIFQANGWTDAELVDQLRAVRLTKWMSFSVCVTAAVSATLVALFVPMFIAVLLLPSSLFFVALGVAMAFKWAVFQGQLEARSLMTPGQFWQDPRKLEWIFS